MTDPSLTSPGAVSSLHSPSHTLAHPRSSQGGWTLAMRPITLLWFWSRVAFLSPLWFHLGAHREDHHGVWAGGDPTRTHKCAYYWTGFPTLGLLDEV